MAEANSEQRWSHTSEILAMLANQWLAKPKYTASDFNPHKRRKKSTLAPTVEIQVLKQIFIDNQGR